MLIACIAFFITVMVIEGKVIDMHNYDQELIRCETFKNLVLDKDIQYYNKVMEVATRVITKQHKLIEELEKSKPCPEDTTNWTSILN